MRMKPRTTAPVRAATCGIVHVQQDLSTVHLPLEHAEVHADIVDVSAIVTVTQRFWQPSPHGLPHAKYIFPVPPRAAVCGFRMTTEDGAVIVAVAKARDQARQEYEAAVKRGKTAGLVEHVTDDVFSITVGALPPDQVITTTVTYVLDLLDGDAADRVRLQIPKCVGMRYGEAPSGMASARQIPPHRVDISIDVHMQGVIRSIASPTDPTVTITDDGPQAASRTARYLSEEFLTQDFVLTVTADGLDAPRCIAERAPNGALAMQLHIVPKFDLPPIPKQEYIFLLDRSGSMYGERMHIAKRAVVMLLRALPSQGTHLNIFSFGDQCAGLWPGSITYNEETMTTATRKVDQMGADWGGTEIRSALEMVFASRRTDKPTACFVLTDGEAWDLDNTLKTVADAVNSAPPASPLRVFTLGIGSSEMCEGIARVGNGLCELATTAQDIVSQCSKLVRASRTFILKNVGIDWGIGDGTVQQAPERLPVLYPGHRCSVFALVEGNADAVPPREVVLCGQRDGHGDVLRFTIPVFTAALPAERRGLVPTLAARALITALDDAARSARPRSAAAAQARARITALGTAYGLASRHTSFVAVDTRTSTELELTTERLRALALADGDGADAGPAARTRAKRRLGDAGAGTGADVAVARILDAYGALGAEQAAAQAARKQLATNAARKTAVRGPARGRAKQTARKVTGGKKPGVGGAGGSSSSGAPPAARPDVVVWDPATSSVVWDPALRASASPAPAAPSTAERVLALVRLQAFDGSFPAGDALAALLGPALDTLPPALPDGTTDQGVADVWTTVLAAAFLARHMPSADAALRDVLVEKALDYVRSAAGLSDAALEALYVRAQELVE